jgi:hypothetical protein
MRKRSGSIYDKVRVTRSLVLYVCFVDRCFCTFSFGQSVLRFMDSDYPFGIFKLFWYNYVHFSISSFTSEVSSSCSTSDTRRVNLVTNTVISHEWGKDREVFTTSGTYPWSFVTQIFHSDQPSHGGVKSLFVLLCFFFWPFLLRYSLNIFY